MVTYATQAFTQTVVVEAENRAQAKGRATKLVVANDDGWEESGGQMFDGEAYAESIREAPDEAPLTEAGGQEGGGDG
jgi:hypothetical protein